MCVYACVSERERGKRKEGERVVLVELENRKNKE